MFIGVSLCDQFEFVMKEWLNDGAFAPGLGGTKDPLVGSNDARDSTFPLPGLRRGAISGCSRFVTTRGGAYLFIPSATALRHLAALAPA